jgi:nitroreductase
MEFSKLVHTRHSIRVFADKKIEVSVLRSILDAAMSAPSAGNLQAYTIHVVRTQEAREAIAIASDQEFIATAPVVLVFCADIDRSERKYGERGAEIYAVQDATIACSYAQLAAANEGLGSVWVGGFEPLEVARIVNAVAYEIPIAVLPIGHPKEKPNATSRRPIEKIVREV